MAKRKVVQVGLDFDGVVAYNPARIIRAPMTFVKRRILGVKKIKFFVPKNRWQKVSWILFHKSSVFPAHGSEQLENLVKKGEYEFHLITARFDFLRDDLDSWLKKHKLDGVFKSINSNLDNEQPHLFKERMLKKLKLDYFVEDNHDIVDHLNKAKMNTKVLWIRNIVDRFIFKNEQGFSDLREALAKIVKEK